MTLWELFNLKTLLAILATKELHVDTTQDIFTGRWSYVVTELVTGFSCQTDSYGDFSVEHVAARCGRIHLARAFNVTYNNAGSIHEPSVLQWIDKREGGVE